MSVPPVDLDLVHALEERLFNAWPALETVIQDGWLIRFARGHTKRANAASAFAAMPSGDDTLINDVRHLYRSAGLRPTFRLTPLAPEGLAERLRQLGWQEFEPSDVLQRSLEEPVVLSGAVDAAIILEHEVSPRWVEGAGRAYALQDWQVEVLGAIVSRIRVPAAFATIVVNRQSVGFGLAVAERGWVGLYDLAVDEQVRGLGLGERMITTLLHWGRSRGARGAYLQVRGSNEGARRLYHRLGFGPAYSYTHYAPTSE